MLKHRSHTQVSISVRSIALIVSFAACFFFVVTYIAFAQGTTGKVDTGGPVVELLGEIVYPIALAIGGLFVGVGGFTLDIAIQNLVVGMGNMWNGPFGIGMIKVWEVIRDVFNILFIFGFIFIGIKTILNSEDSNTRRALGHLIIAALFINFSLLIAQVVIDFSNVAATQIYNMAAAGIDETAIGNTASESPSLTMAFLDVVSLGSFFDAKPENIKGAQLIIYSILMMIFFIIAGIIFLFAAYHVIYRFVALIIYMILSPVLFLGFILPNFQAYTDRWVGGLLRQSFFAPAFLFLVYVSLLAIDRLKASFGIQGGEDGFPSIMDGADMTTSGFLIFVFFGIGIGFLYASVKVGDIMGISGSKTAMNVLNGARKGVQGMMYRNTVGRGIRFAGVGAMDALDRAAEGKSWYHPANITRSIAGGENTRRAMEKASNYGAGGEGLSDAEKRDKERSQRASTGVSAVNLRKAIAAGTRTNATTNEKIAMENELAGASVPDLVKLAQSGGDELLTQIVGNLPEKKFDSLMDSNDLSPALKGKLAAGRKQSVERVLRDAGTKRNLTQTEDEKLREGIKGATPEQLNAMDFEKLTQDENIIYLQAGQLEKLESKWGDEKMRIVKDKRKAAILAEFSQDPGRILNSRKGDKEIAKLPSELFAGNNLGIMLDELQTSGKLTGGLLQNIANETSMSGAEKKSFGAAVKGRFRGIIPPGDIEGFFRSSLGVPYN